MLQQYLLKPCLLLVAFAASISSVESSLRKQAVEDPKVVTLKDGTSCTFSDDPPKPVLLMSKGRSGSSVTWATISRIVGYPNEAYEHAGGNPSESVEFFDNITEEEGSQWATYHLCKLQERRQRKFKLERSPGIVGFQWKPFTQTIDREYAIGALEDLGAHGIPVIYLRRNPIDRRASNLRHAGKKNTGLTAHCEVGDSACLERQHQDSKVTFDYTQKEILKFLRRDLDHHKMMLQRFEQYNIHYVEVSYENLYHQDNADEWNKLLEFLGFDLKLTLEEVQENFVYAATSNSKQPDKINNYDEMSEMLKDTDFEKYLDTVPDRNYDDPESEDLEGEKLEGE